MKEFCIIQGTFLTDLLGLHIQTVYDLKLSCELDPTRLQTTDLQRELGLNASRLTNYCQNILASIVDSVRAGKGVKLHS